MIAPRRPDDEAPWGHASGWAQLYGQRRNVSCVVLGLDHTTGLAEIFDSLSDALTEAGYPWEVLMVFAGANRQLSSLLGAWCERPGFRRISLPSDTSAALTLKFALEQARGDAVLLLEAHGGELSVPIPEMVSQWSDGVEIVRSRWLDSAGVGSTGQERPQVRSAGSVPTPSPQGDGLKRLLGEEALLLDRRVIEVLLGRHE